MIDNKTLSLQTNFIWTLIGNGTYAASQWGVVIFLSKFGNVEMVGTFALALAIVAPVILFGNLALRSVQATDISQVYEFGHYLALRLVTASGAFVIIVGIVLVMHYPFDIAKIIIIVGLAKSFESISDVIYGLFQQRERMDKISLSMMLKGLLSLLGVAVGMFLGQNLVLAMVGLAIAWGLTLIIYDLPLGRMMIEAEKPHSAVKAYNKRLRPFWNWNQIFNLARFTLPLGVATSMVSINFNIPRYFLENRFGVHDLGIFSALIYPFTAGLLVVNALGQSASPRLARYFEYGNVRKFKNLLFVLTGIGLVVGLAGVVITLFIGRQLLIIIYQPEYANYGQELLWLAITMGIEFTFSFMGYGMTAVRYYKIQPIIYFISIILSLGFGYVLIPLRGILGAIQVILITTCFRSTAMIGVNIYALRKSTIMKLESTNETS